MDSPEERIDLIESFAAERDFQSAQAELERWKKGNDLSSGMNHTVHTSAQAGELYYL